jgi:hypothetical protein
MTRRSTTFYMAAALAVVLAAGDARAYWKSTGRVVMNSAYTLEEGELAIGVLSPLQYGVSDTVTIAIHPVLALLLTPNVSARYKVYDGPVTVSIAGSYLQTFLERVAIESQAPAAEEALPYLREQDLVSIVDTGFPGYVELGTLVSIPLGDSVTLTPYAGYSFKFFTIVEDGLETRLSDHGLSYGLGTNWLIGPSDLLSLQVQALWSAERIAQDIPTATLVWAHAWEEIRIGVGVAVGTFPIRTGEAIEDLVELPVYPYLDLWWRR